MISLRGNGLPSLSARSGSNSWNWIFFGKPCGKSGEHAGRAPGLACRHLRAHRDADVTTAARRTHGGTDVGARGREPGRLLPASAAKEFDVVAAPSISGVPYANVLSHKFGKRLVIDRGIPSKYGMRLRIEGDLRKGDRAIIVDDIAKRGQTLLEIAEEITALGAIIARAL